MEVYNPVFVLRLQTGAVVVERPFHLRSGQIIGSQLHIDGVARHAVLAVGPIGMFLTIFSYRLYGAVLLIHQDVGPEALAVGIERTDEHHLGAFHGILARAERNLFRSFCIPLAYNLTAEGRRGGCIVTLYSTGCHQHHNTYQDCGKKITTVFSIHNHFKF